MSNEKGNIFRRILSSFFGFIIGWKARDASRKLLGNSGEIAEMARKLFDISAELSSSSTEQAAALQETSSSAHQVSAIVSQNADNAKLSQQAAALSLQTAERGKQAVAHLTRSIEDLGRSNDEVIVFFEDSNRQYTEIMQVINEVGSKTKVINDIVFQTKLLSFNAAVEAARAGEHGKGFAVVAEEVGNLAEMSGNASREISQMLVSSIQKVERIAAETCARVELLSAGSRRNMETSTDNARTCGKTLAEIVEKVSDVNSLITKISKATAEQSTGVQEINQAIHQLNSVMQSNAVSTTEAAAISQKLRNEAVQLGHMARLLVAALDAQDRPPGRGLGKVLPLRRKNVKEKGAAVPDQGMKMAAGAERIPSRDDKRFEEV